MTPAVRRATGRPSGELRGLRRVRWQLTAWYVGTLCVILAVLGAGLFRALSTQLAAQLDASLAEAEQSLARAAADAEVGTAADAREAAARLRLIRVPGRALYLLRDDGTPLVPDTAEAWVRDVARTAARTGALVGDRELPNERTVRIRAERLQSQDRVALVAVVVANRVEWEDQNASLVTVFTGAAAFAVLLIGIGGYLLARRSMLPIEETFGYMRRFMADAAHELRTPLTVLRTRVEFALRQPRAPTEDAATLRDIAADSERLGGIVEDLLTLARADSGEQPTEPRRVFLDDAVAEAGSAARVVARAKGVGLEMEQFDEAIVMGDPDRLRQLALILLDNGVKFTPPGGTVRVRVGTNRGQPFLVVEDTGIGIADADLPRIFERFYRADPARNGSEVGAGPGSGVGLGLSIARWIADVHGATIEVRSAHGAGTTVTVTFPAPDPSPHV